MISQEKKNRKGAFFVSNLSLWGHKFSFCLLFLVRQCMHLTLSSSKENSEDKIDKLNLALCSIWWTACRTDYDSYSSNEFERPIYCIINSSFFLIISFWENSNKFQISSRHRSLLPHNFSSFFFETVKPLVGVYTYIYICLFILRTLFILRLLGQVTSTLD